MQQPKTGTILREFASCFKDKKLRMRFPYIRIMNNRITCTDSYIVLDYFSDTAFLADFGMVQPGQRAFVKAEHAGQFSRNDGVKIDGRYAEGTESGLIVPLASEDLDSVTRLFDNVDKILNDEFSKIGDSSRDRANFAAVNADFMHRVFQAFKKCGFSDSTITINSSLEPLCIKAVNTVFSGRERRMDAFTMRALAMPIRR